MTASVQRAAIMLEGSKRKRDALLKEDEQPKPAAPAVTTKMVVTPQQAKEVRQNIERHQGGLSDLHNRLRVRHEEN